MMVQEIGTIHCMPAEEGKYVEGVVSKEKCFDLCVKARQRGGCKLFVAGRNWATGQCMLIPDSMTCNYVEDNDYEVYSITDANSIGAIPEASRSAAAEYGAPVEVSGFTLAGTTLTITTAGNFLAGGVVVL